MQEKMVALVTGANKGLGKQVAKELAGHGYTVLLGSRDFSNGQKAAEEIGDGAVAIQLDVTDAASIAKAAERVAAEFGRLDLLVKRNDGRSWLRLRGKRLGIARSFWIDDATELATE